MRSLASQITDYARENNCSIFARTISPNSRFKGALLVIDWRIRSNSDSPKQEGCKCIMLEGKDCLQIRFVGPLNIHFCQVSKITSMNLNNLINEYSDLKDRIQQAILINSAFILSLAAISNDTSDKDEYEDMQTFTQFLSDLEDKYSSIPIQTIIDNEVISEKETKTRHSLKRSLSDHLEMDTYSIQDSVNEDFSPIPYESKSKGNEIVSTKYMGSQSKRPATNTIIETKSASLAELKLIFDNEKNEILCSGCKLPIISNSSCSFECSYCGHFYHSRCIWGQFYLIDPSIQQSSLKRFWLCCHCLVHKNIEIFDNDERQWLPIHVLGYYPSTNQHAIKIQQNILIIRLGQYRIRIPKEMNNMEWHIENTPTNASIITIENGCHTYRNASTSFSSYKSFNYHSQPQLFSYRTNSNPRDNGIHYIQYRRYGLKHNIEVLVFWENGSYYNAQWIPQTKLKGNGSKECDNYLARQYLYSPLWKYVLNIAEEQLFYQLFSPAFLTDYNIVSTCNRTEVCCHCHSIIEENQNSIICDICDGSYHWSCVKSSITTSFPQEEWICEHCRLFPFDHDKGAFNVLYSCWLPSGKQLKLTSYQLHMLPTGNELLKRSDREWNQIDSIIELNEQEKPILPLPSLASILQQQYTGDELHIDFDKDIDSFTRHKTEDLLLSLDTFHVAHVITDTLACDYPIYACAIYHLFQTNRLRGPTLILCPLSSVDIWLHCFHTYTTFKVAVLGELGQDRRSQWNEYLGPLRSLFVGEFNIYIMTTSSFKMHQTTDVNYLTSIGFSLVLVDDYLHVRGYPNDLAFTNDLKEHVQRLQDIEYEYLIARWPVPNDHPIIKSSFLYSLYLYIPKHVKNMPYNSSLTNNQILSAVYDHYAKLPDKAILSSIQKLEIHTMIPFFFQQHFKTTSLLTEACIFCPLTIFQTRCLKSLYCRWNFAIQSYNYTQRSTRIKDLTANLLFEILRIYTHPFLAGCSEALLQECSKEDWCSTFKQASSKVIMCDYLIQSFKQQHHTSFCIYSKNLRVLQYLQSYYTQQHYTVYCIFGVHTYEEFQQTIKAISSSTDFSIILLGQLPIGIQLDLHSIENVIIYDSEIIPSLDIDSLYNYYNIGVVTKVNVFRLIIPTSLEAEYFNASSIFHEQYQQFTLNASNTMNSIIQKYLRAYDSKQNQAFLSSKYNAFQTGMITPILLDPIKHEYTSSSYNQIKSFIGCEGNGFLRVPVISTPIQSLLEKIWKMKSFQDVERVYSSLLSELPEVIKDTSYSLSNLDMEILEKCSLMDMLLCQFMMYLVESWNGEIPDPVYNSKKKKGRLTDDVFSGVPIFNTAKQYLCRIRLAMRFNNYWIVVPYQDIFRKCS